MLHKPGPLALGALLALTILLPLAHGNPPLFDAPWRGYDTGVYPAAFAPKKITAGDLDGDGDLDVVAGNSFFAGPGISILRNLGDGTYDLPLSYATPSNQQVNDVALLDMDGDADLDVLATISDIFGGNNKVGLWRNNGNATFGTRVDFTVGLLPSGIVVSDFNGDSFPDVATANYNGDNVSLLKHNGLAGPSASFLPAVHFPASVNSEHLAAGDVNGDGKLDLVVGGFDLVNFVYTGLHSILINDGSGAFTRAREYAATDSSFRTGGTVVALADVDNDGKLDLFGAGGKDEGSTSIGVITLRHGNGDGTFGALSQYDLEDNVWVAAELTTADLNGDGFQDLVAATPSGRASDGFNVLLNNKAGGFSTAVFYPASQQTYDAKAFDADRDGDLDIITVAQSSAAITVHPNPGSGIFPRPVQFPVGLFSEALDIADIDGDGDIDAVTNDTDVRILKNNGNGTFGLMSSYNPPYDYADMKLRDLNGDGFPDLLLGPDKEFPPYNFATALNNGNGTFAAGKIVAANSCGEGSIDAFDLDNDGDLDVVLTEEQGCASVLSSRIFIYRNDGAGNLTAVASIIPPGFAFGIDAADTNGDGNLDLVTSLPGGIGVFLGNGNLTFQPALQSSTAPYKFTTADFNQDGKIDVGMIIPQLSFGTVYIATALGNGNGTFQAARQQSGSSVLESAFLISHDIDAGDLNGDGYPDIVVSNDASNDLSVFLTNPDGSLSPHQRYGTGYGSFFSSIGDLTGDGVPDIATLYWLPPFGFQNVVAVLKGLGAGGANQAPTVAISKPLDGARFSASRPVQVVATAADADGSIARVDFLVDGVVFATVTQAPYRASLTKETRQTPYILTARAADNEGAETLSAPVSITIKRGRN